MPFFSILIPTRNRAELLVEHALKSVLNQTFKDFEVVVCDNASTDNTEGRVKEIEDPRVRYVRSPEWIQKEHFFEFSFKQAKGEYSMIFCDDDYLTTTALGKAYNILSKYNTEMLVYTPRCIYLYPDWHDSSNRNFLRIPCFSRKLFKLDSSQHLRMIFERQAIMTESPMVTDVFYRTSFINSLLDKFGHIFTHGHMGDYNTACYTLSHTKHYLYLDEPLTVFGHWKSNTSEQLHDLKTSMPEYKEWIEWITDNYLDTMPVRTYQWNNCVAASLKDMKNILNLTCDIDTVQYFYSLVRELVELDMRGIDVSAQKQEWYRAFYSMPAKIRRDVFKRMVSDFGKMIANNFRCLRSLIIRASGDKNVAEELSYNTPNSQYYNEDNLKLIKGDTIIKGDIYGFNNISGAGEFYESFLSGRVRILPDSYPMIVASNILRQLRLVCATFRQLYNFLRYKCEYKMGKHYE